MSSGLWSQWHNPLNHSPEIAEITLPTLAPSFSGMWKCAQYSQNSNSLKLWWSLDLHNTSLDAKFSFQNFNFCSSIKSMIRRSYLTNFDPQLASSLKQAKEKVIATNKITKIPLKKLFISSGWSLVSDSFCFSWSCSLKEILFQNILFQKQCLACDGCFGVFAKIKKGSRIGS